MAALEPTLETLKVGVIGGSGVGKTSLIARYLTGHYDMEIEAANEAGDEYLKHTVVGEEHMLLNIKEKTPDESGSLKNDFAFDELIRESDAFMIIFDSLSNESLELASVMIMAIMRTKEIIPDDEFPMLLVGTKMDLEHLHQISDERAKETADTWGVTLFRVSSLKGTNVSECFEELIRIHQRIRKERRLEKKITRVGKPGCSIL